MAPGGSTTSNPPRTRKRVNADANALKRAKNGSAFTRCEECKKDVPVVLIDMHDCSLDSKIKMSLEAQVIEMVAEKTKTVSSESKPRSRRTTKEKKAKDPNMPKRPTTAFFLFMEEFRKTFKEENPDNKSVSVVAKEGGTKWKSMSDEEKKPFMDRFQELKAEYEKNIQSFNAENAEEVQEVEEEQETEKKDQEQGTDQEEQKLGASDKEEE